MPQGILPYKYEKEKTDSGMTSLAGLPVYLDFAAFHTDYVRQEGKAVLSRHTGTAEAAPSS